MSAQTAPEPKRRGRPPKDPNDRKSGNLTFRTRAGLREWLEEAAKASGRSISEEVEFRLEQGRSIEGEFGSGSRLDLLRLMAVTLRFTERLTASSDYDDRTSLVEFKSALNTMLDEMLRAKGPQSNAQALADALGHVGGVGRAAALTLATGTLGIPDGASEQDIAARKASAALVANILASGQPGGSVGHQQALEADIRFAAEREGVSPEELLKRLRDDPTSIG